MPGRTTDELKQLARDIHNGLVFTSNHVPIAPSDVWISEVCTIFMPLVLMEQAALDVFSKMNVTLLYEYYEKAGPRSINGYPMFMSVNVVTADEWPTLLRYLQLLREAPDPLADERRGEAQADAKLEQVDDRGCDADG